jgi:hypothetical protein
MNVRGSASKRDAVNVSNPVLQQQVGEHTQKTEASADFAAPTSSNLGTKGSRNSQTV